MKIFKCLTGAATLMLSVFCAQGQDMTAKHKMWLEANMDTKQDAVDFITTTYKDYTALIGKHEMESGIYKREIKLKKHLLTIETESRDQGSSYKGDRDFIKNIVVIDLDKVVLDGDDLKPSSADNVSALTMSNGSKHRKNIASYSILTAAPNRDNDKFINQHCEEHLQWAYQYLIDRCSGKSN